MNKKHNVGGGRPAVMQPKDGHKPVKMQSAERKGNIGGKQNLTEVQNDIK